MNSGVCRRLFTVFPSVGGFLYALYTKKGYEHASDVAFSHSSMIINTIPSSGEENYSLTPKGEDLLSAFDGIYEWGKKWIGGETESRPQ